MLKHFPHALASLGTALEVADGANLLRNRHTLLGADRPLARLAQLLNNLGVSSQILLASDKDDGQILAEVEHLRDPLLLDVVERVGRVNSEADQDHVAVGVRERSQSVVVLLAGGIPERELDVSSVNLNVRDVVLKDGGDVDLGEGTLKQTDSKSAGQCQYLCHSFLSLLPFSGRGVVSTEAGRVKPFSRQGLSIGSKDLSCNRGGPDKEPYTCPRRTTRSRMPKSKDSETEKSGLDSRESGRRRPLTHLAKDDQKTGLTAGTVTDDDKLSAKLRHDASFCLLPGQTDAEARY